MDINIPNKNTGEYLSATEFNEVVDGINSKANESALQSEIDSRIAQNTILESQLNSKLESSDFKTINGSSIVGTGNFAISGASIDGYTKVQSDNKYQLIGNYLTGITSVDYSIITNKPTLFSGSYTDLTSKPSLFDGNYTSLSNKPTLFSGSYADLTGKPIIPTLISQLSNDSGFVVATGLTNNYYSKSQSDLRFITGITSVDYSLITNKPTIPTGTTQLINNSNFITQSALSGYTTNTGLTTALSFKADLVAGLIPISQLPEANLSPLQFETLPDGTIGIRLSYLQSLGLVGTGTTTPTLSAPINLSLSGISSSAITISWNGVTNATSYQLQRANNSGFTGSSLVYSGVTTSFVNTGLTASTNYFYRVKATASGYNDSSFTSISGVTLASSTGSTYTVEKTIFINLKSEYNSNPTTTPAYVNVAQPSNATLNIASGYTSGNLVDITNVASGIQFMNSGAFGGGVGEISASQTTAGNVGVYENAMVNTAWSMNGGNNAKLKFFGLNPAKFYHFYFLMPSAFNDTVRGVTINGTTINKPATTSSATFGTLGNGLNDSQFIVFNNLTGLQIESAIARVSGNYEATLAMIVIEQSNIAKA